VEGIAVLNANAQPFARRAENPSVRVPGQYGDILRVVGRIVDERQAQLRAELEAAEPQRQRISHLEITEYEAFMAVSWKTAAGAAGSQAYTELNLRELREEAHRLRGESANGQKAGEYEELLRTLGQELDAEQIGISAILEQHEEFVVTGASQGRYFSRHYPVTDLHELSLERQQLRAPAYRPETPAASAGQRRWWFLGRRSNG
jgi:hypothetical protein